MISKISEGVEISVETFYQSDYSNPTEQNFMFAYRITIHNYNSFSIQLLKRNWQIYDSNGERRKVDGDGVVGEQPILKPNENYSYISGCNLKTEMGKMQGFYTMENQNNKQLFRVSIPAFDLIAPAKMN